MTTYRVTHRTEYRYADEVESSYGQAHLLPRDHARQACRSSDLQIVPTPEDVRERVDFFGNRAVHFAVHEPHTRLAVVSTSLVSVDADAARAPLLGNQPWEQVRDHLVGATDPDSLEARPFVLDSPLVATSDRLRAYAAPSFGAGRGIVDAVLDLCHRIHVGFEFEPGSTTVSTTIDEVLDGGLGVCQDFAHVAIGAVRSMGLPARYVSGYLETDPPPGRPRLKGSDVSHAWISVHVPELGWLDVDPTNDQVVGDRYVTTAWGRDYADVTPLRGVIFTDGQTEELTVEVDVVRTG